MLLKEYTLVFAHENVKVKLGVFKIVWPFDKTTLFLARRSFAFLLLESIMSLLTSSENVSTYRLSRYAPNRKPAHSTVVSNQWESIKQRCSRELC
jgi:hypothetical protein